MTKLKNIFGEILDNDAKEAYNLFIEANSSWYPKHWHISIKYDIAALSIILGEIKKSKDFSVCNTPQNIIKSMLHSGKYNIGVFPIASPVALGISAADFADIIAYKAHDYGDNFYTYNPFYFGHWGKKENNLLVKKWLSVKSKKASTPKLNAIKEQCDITIQKIGLPKIDWKRINLYRH